MAAVITPAMSTKKREVIFGGRIMGAKIRAQHALELAKKAQRDADRAEADLWSIRMEAYGGPAQPSCARKAPHVHARVVPGTPHHHFNSLISTLRPTASFVNTSA